MTIKGLEMDDSDGRVVVKYLDVAEIDVSAMMKRIFNKVFGPEGKSNGQTGRACKEHRGGTVDTDGKGPHLHSVRAEDDITEVGNQPD